MSSATTISKNFPPLSSFDVSTDRGFLPLKDPLTRLPGRFDPWEEMARSLPSLLASGKVRDSLASFPPLDVSRLQEERQLRRAGVRLAHRARLFPHSTRLLGSVMPRGG